MPRSPQSSLFQVESAESTPSSTESSLGVSTTVLTDNVWVSMKRRGTDANTSIRFLDGVNPKENRVWLAYGFGP